MYGDKKWKKNKVKNWKWEQKRAEANKVEQAAQNRTINGFFIFKLNPIVASIRSSVVLAPYCKTDEESKELLSQARLEAIQLINSIDKIIL